MPLLAIPLILLALAFVELWLLIKMGGAIGILPTLLLVFGAGIAGAALARRQGFQAMTRLNRQMQQGTLPARTIADSALILLAGILLILPGVISDVMGLLLLIPFVRRVVMLSFASLFTAKMRVHTNVRPGGFSAADTVRNNSTIVDARVIEAHVVDDEK